MKHDKTVFVDIGVEMCVSVCVCVWHSVMLTLQRVWVYQVY